MLSPELRSSLYSLFSDLFTFPDQDSNPLLDRDMLEEVANLLGIVGPPPIGVEELVELQAAYTGLFINRPGGVLAHLYAAVYLESEPRLMGESTRAALAAYQEAGLNPEQSTEPPDSLPLELEFMSYLAEKQDQAIKTGDLDAAEEFLRKQVSFCRNCLYPWVYQFCARLTDDETAHPLYRWGAQLLERFCQMEELYLSDQEP